MTEGGSFCCEQNYVKAKLKDWNFGYVDNCAPELSTTPRTPTWRSFSYSSTSPPTAEPKNNLDYSLSTGVIVGFIVLALIVLALVIFIINREFKRRYGYNLYQIRGHRLGNDSSHLRRSPSPAQSVNRSVLYRRQNVNKLLEVPQPYLNELLDEDEVTLFDTSFREENETRNSPPKSPGNNDTTTSTATVPLNPLPPPLIPEKITKIDASQIVPIVSTPGPSSNVNINFNVESNPTYLERSSRTRKPAERFQVPEQKKGSKNSTSSKKK